jgi:DNA-binding response OmpR family regulator
MTKPHIHISSVPEDHLLLVDSDENESYILAALLQRFKYYVITARTGARALESMAASMPVLVLTTQKLPDMGGADLIGRLNQASGTAGAPVIVIGEANDVGAEKDLLDAGAAAYLAKPLRVEDLYRAIQSAIESTPRENIRINTSLPITIDGVELDYEGGECVSTLSEQGMHVKTRMPQQHKMQHSVLIRIHDRAISLIAKVLYRQEPHNTVLPEPGMGLKFVQISSEDRQYIKQYVLEEVTKGISYGGRKDFLEGPVSNEA